MIGNRASIQIDDRLIVPIAYRPLDNRWTYFDNKLLWRWREDVMRNMIDEPNLDLMVTRQTKDEVGALVVGSIAAHKAFSAYDITYNFPLYLYPNDRGRQHDAFFGAQRRVNFEPKLFAAICKAAELSPTANTGTGDAFLRSVGENRPTEVKVFDYIYGVLHSPD